MLMLTSVTTAKEFNMLPSSIKHVIRGGMGKVSAQDRAWVLQNVVVNAVKEKQISYDLAVEILTVNRAYGKRGKKVLDEVKNGD